MTWFFDEIFTAAIKTVTLPITILQDVVAPLEGEVPSNTVKQIGSAVKNVGKGIKDLGDGKL